MVTIPSLCGIRPKMPSLWLVAWAGAFAIHLSSPRLVCGADADDERPSLLASTPVLAQLVREVGGDAVSVAAVWDGKCPPSSFRVPVPLASLEGPPGLFFQYGQEPFAQIDATVTRALPERIRAVVLDSLPPGPQIKGGDKALDPAWSYFSAGSIAAELARLLPGKAREFQGRLGILRLRLGLVTFGTAARAEGKLESLFTEWAAGKAESGGERNTWLGRLGPFASIPVHDPWKVLSPVCARFHLKPIGEDDLGAQTAALAFPVVVDWTTSPSNSAQTSFATVVGKLSPTQLAVQDGESLVSRVGALLSDLEPLLAVSMVRRELSRVPNGLLVKPAVAVRFDERHVAELLRLLSAPERARWWENVVLLLGYAGDERAYDPIADFLTKRFAGKKVSDEVFAALNLAPWGLGLLARRSERALAFLEQGCSEKFWKKRIKWHSDTFDRETMVVELADNCIRGMGLSGRKDLEWIMALARKKEMKPAWAAIITADMFMWWQETRGYEEFLREWRAAKGSEREEAHWKSERAAALKAVVTPKGVKLPKTLRR